MKKIIASILSIILFAIPIYAQSLSDKRAYEKASEPFAKYEVFLVNPCEDEVYLKLKKMEIDDMSDREFEIFKEKDRACNDYQQNQIFLEPENKRAESIEKAANAGQAYLIIAGIGLVITLVYLINASNDLDDLGY